MLSQVVAIKEKRLSEFQKKFTSFNELKTKTFKVSDGFACTLLIFILFSLKKIFETNDNVENILQSTKPHLLEKALDKIIETVMFIASIDITCMSYCNFSLRRVVSPLIDSSFFLNIP